jgi:hypothetical protein
MLLDRHEFPLTSAWGIAPTTHNFEFFHVRSSIEERRLFIIGTGEDRSHSSDETRERERTDVKGRHHERA